MNFFDKIILNLIYNSTLYNFRVIQQPDPFFRVGQTRASQFQGQNIQTDTVGQGIHIVLVEKYLRKNQKY